MNSEQYQKELESIELEIADAKIAGVWLKDLNPNSQAIDWLVGFMSRGENPKGEPPSLDITADQIMLIKAQATTYLGSEPRRHLYGYLECFLLPLIKDKCQAT